MTPTKKLDHVKAFLAFLSFQGDVSRTALACEVDTEEIESLATRENWAGKVKQFSALKESDPKFQIGLNRILNYVQARQIASVVDTLITHFSQMTPDELVEILTTTTKNGCTFEVKPLTDLAKAAELCQSMACRALGDTGGQMEGADKLSGGAIGLSVAKALNEIATNPGMDAVKLVQKSLNDAPSISGATPQ
jgi:hypothetical protein